MGRSAEPAAEGTGCGGSWRLVVSLGQVARAQEAPGGRAGVVFCCRGPAPLLWHGLSEALDPTVASGWPSPELGRQSPPSLSDVGARPP